MRRQTAVMNRFDPILTVDISFIINMKEMTISNFFHGVKVYRMVKSSGQSFSVILNHVLNSFQRCFRHSLTLHRLRS